MANSCVKATKQVRVNDTTVAQSADEWHKLKFVLLHNALFKLGFHETANKFRDEANLDDLIAKFLLSRGCRETMKVARKEGLGPDSRKKWITYVNLEATGSDSDVTFVKTLHPEAVSCKKDDADRCLTQEDEGSVSVSDGDGLEYDDDSSDCNDVASRSESANRPLRDGLRATHSRKLSKYVDLVAEESDSGMAITTAVHRAITTRKKVWDETDQMNRCSVCSWEWGACQCVASEDERVSFDSAGIYSVGDSAYSAMTDDESSYEESSASAMTDDESSYEESSAIQDGGEPTSTLEEGESAAMAGSDAFSSESEVEWLHTISLKEARARVRADCNSSVSSSLDSESPYESDSSTNANSVVGRKAVKRARSADVKSKSNGAKNVLKRMKSSGITRVKARS